MSDDGSTIVPSYKTASFGMLCARHGECVPRRLARLLELVKFEHPPFPVRLSCSCHVDNTKTRGHKPSPFHRPMVGFLQIDFVVADRDTGRVGPLTFVESGEWDECLVGRAREPAPADGELLLAARRAVHVLAMHEVDEAFTFGGMRVFDPHDELAADKAAGRIQNGLKFEPDMRTRRRPWPPTVPLAAGDFTTLDGGFG